MSHNPAAPLPPTSFLTSSLSLPLLFLILPPHTALKLPRLRAVFKQLRPATSSTNTDSDAQDSGPSSEEGQDQGQGHQGQPGAAAPPPRAPLGLLEAWVSGMVVHFERSGAITQRRVDILVGAPGLKSTADGVHLALWGSAHPDTDALAMTVGLPAPTLASLGCEGLPAGYCLPIQLGGTIGAPRLQLRGVARKVTALGLQQAVTKYARHARDVRDSETDSETGRDGDGTAGATGAASGSDEEGTEGEQQPTQHDHGHRGGGGWRRGLKALALAAVARLLPHSVSPAGMTEQLEREAARVPVQSQPVPWLEPDSTHV